MKPYHNIPLLQNIYLEDSWVTGIRADQEKVTFKLEFVLTEAHEDYEPPHKAEQYCYKKGILIFDDCEDINWLKVNHIRSIDKNDDIDMGNIDTFTFHENKYFLSGDWGEVEIACKGVSLNFCSEETEKGAE